MFAIENLQISWLVVVVLGAFTVLGLVQMLKGALKKVPTWIWAVIATVGYYALAALVVFAPSKFVVFLVIGTLMLSVGQIGYEALWQTIISWIRRALGVPTPADAKKLENASAGLPGS